MADMSAVNMLRKGSEFQWESDKAYHWTEDAACAFLPPTMFELAHGGSKIAEGLTEKELKDLNSANFEAAQKACQRCPVWHLCYQEADDEDFKETVRAGLIPLRHNPDTLGRPRKAASEVFGKNNPEDPCKNGHPIEDWTKRPDCKDSWYCKSCRREARGSVRRNWLDPSKPCKNDHPIEDWRKRADSDKAWYCLGCKREEASRRRKKEVKPRFIIDPEKPCQEGHMEWTLSGGYWRCRACKRDRERAARAEAAKLEA